MLPEACRLATEYGLPPGSVGAEELREVMRLLSADGNNPFKLVREASAMEEVEAGGAEADHPAADDEGVVMMDDTGAISAEEAAAAAACLSEPYELKDLAAAQFEGDEHLEEQAGDGDSGVEGVIPKAEDGSGDVELMKEEVPFALIRPVGFAEPEGREGNSADAADTLPAAAAADKDLNDDPMDAEAPDDFIPLEAVQVPKKEEEEKEGAELEEKKEGQQGLTDNGANRGAGKEGAGDTVVCGAEPEPQVVEGELCPDHATIAAEVAPEHAEGPLPEEGVTSSPIAQPALADGVEEAQQQHSLCLPPELEGMLVVPVLGPHKDLQVR